MQLGDEVLVRMLPGLDPRTFGSGWRIGVIVGLGTDILADEPVIELDDHGPRIYAAHVDFLTVLRKSVPAFGLVPSDVFDGL